MSTRVAIIAVLGLLVTGARAASAQAASRPFTFELGGGASFLAGDDRAWFKDGYNAQAGVGIPTALPQLQLQGAVFYHAFGGKWKSDQVVVGAPDTLRLGDFSVLAATVGARWRMTNSTSTEAFRPYATVGAGAYRITSEAELYGRRVSGSDTKFGATFGLGMDISLFANALFVEARVHNVFSDVGSARLYPITLGFRF